MTLVPEGDVPAGESTVAFTFPDPAIVEAGTQYALVLVRSGPSNVSWASRAGDVCTGRAFASDGLAAPFVVRSDRDYVYTTIVRS